MMLFYVPDTSSKYCFVALLSWGRLWSMPPGSAGFYLCFCASGNVEIALPFVGRKVVSLLCLSRVPWTLYLPGKLFQFPYQTLVNKAERLHLVRVGLHCFQCVRRSIVYVAWRILHPWRIGVAPACVPS